MTHRLLLPLLLCAASAIADSMNPCTDWFRDARYGVFVHCLPANSEQLHQLADFDIEHLAEQLQQAGAGYLVITLGQNSGYFISPNAAYDKVAGYQPGERCARRDLPLELFRALQPRGIKLLLYLPCQVPNQDAHAQRAFGLPSGAADQPLTVPFAERWAKVIAEWSERYGDKVAGWWFDGAYQHIAFNEPIAQIYANAVKRGNPQAIVTFNPGVRVVRHTQAEDYTAGELNEPLDIVPVTRWLEGSQWHALTYLGSGWAHRDTRFSVEQWVRWIQTVNAHEGVVTLDLGPNWTTSDGPIGTLAPAQLLQLQAIRKAIRH